MASIFPDDILLPAGDDHTNRRSGRAGIAAIVPITIAIIGVATILVGRVTVSEIAASDFLGSPDPLVAEFSEGVIEPGIEGMPRPR
jgi:hypothetical protein